MASVAETTNLGPLASAFRVQARRRVAERVPLGLAILLVCAFTGAALEWFLFPDRRPTLLATDALFLGVAMGAGRRAGCQSICWMAPFMIAGRWIRNRFGWPSLRLVADAERCRDCGSCTKACPMGLDVEKLVHAASMENAECVLCASCADACPQKAIRFSFSAGR